MEKQLFPLLRGPGHICSDGTFALSWGGHLCDYWPSPTPRQVCGYLCPCGKLSSQFLRRPHQKKRFVLSLDEVLKDFKEYVCHRQTPQIERSQITETSLSFMRVLCFYCHVKNVRVSRHAAVIREEISEDLRNPRNVEGIVLQIISYYGKRQRWTDLVLCLRLSVPLFQEMAARGKASGLHSITMSPPTWTTESFLMGFLKKSGAEAKNKIF